MRRDVVRVTPDDLARLDREVMAFILAREASMGLADGGLEAYYGNRARAGRGLAPHERFWIGRLQGERRVFHAGIGLGPVLAGLARAGVEGVGFEMWPPRYRAAQALREALGPNLGYDIRQSNYPEGLRAGDRCGDATLLFTNVGAGWTEQQLDEVISTMHRFAQTFLDLRLFGWRRESEQERADLATRVEDAAFTVTPVDTGGRQTFYVRVASLGDTE